MVPLALQMSASDATFWIMVMTVITAVSFVVIAVAMVAVAVVVARLVRTVTGVERKVEPLAERVAALTEQVRQVVAEGKVAAEHVGLMSGHLSTATMHFSESMGLIKDEVRELKQVVGLSAETARDKVEMISRTIDETHRQLAETAGFVSLKIVRPAREIAAIMAGVRRGLEVFLAPAPKQIDQSYAEEEMFIG
ncbi:MAG TPA: hypothetical protein VEY09_12255 [Pyrinomonadaceae bacterium]|nr:hypothetical protein [Pyrinomonadaceae bacterium]